MLKLPSKKWKKVQFRAKGQGTYELYFISSLKDENELKKIVKDDIEECLDENDRVIGVQWETKSVTLAISDSASFRRRLIFASILIEE
jgi:hypothetical protein